MTALLPALTIAALVLLPGAMVFSLRLAFTTWRRNRRRNARGAWRLIAYIRPLAGRDSY